MTLDDTTIKILLGAAGAIIGAIITYISARLSASQKVRELEISYAQRLKDNYLQNARQVINEVYIPLNIELTKLNQDFIKFKSIDKVDEDSEAIDSFKETSMNFISQIDNLIARGADAYLTNQLEEKLLLFLNFLRNSQVAQKTTTKLWVNYNTSILGIMRANFQQNVKTTSDMLPRGKYSFGFPYLRIAYDNNEIVAAKIPSKDFEEKISEEIVGLKFLIKEVTLGTHVN